MDENCTNGVEGLNFAAKHATMASKPCNSMETSAASMSAHTQIKMKENRHRLLCDSTQAPLFIDYKQGHDLGCIRAIRPLATFMLVSQYALRNSYNIVWLQKDWLIAIRASVSKDGFSTEQVAYPHFRAGGHLCCLGNYFKTPSLKFPCKIPTPDLFLDSFSKK